jgi:hypothetical protein
MSEYLLPCSCGQRLRVSTSQAGQTLRCACGAELEVPTLRHLRELERAAAPAAGRPSWDHRQRVGFVLAVVTLGALAVAGYLALNLPADPTPAIAAEVDQNIAISVAYTAYEDLKRGLEASPPPLSQDDRRTLRRRELLIWGIKIALALAALSIAVAAVGMLSGGRKKR